MSVLPVPAAAVSKVWVNAPVSVPASVPEVTVGMPAELVVPSNALVSVDGGHGDGAGGDLTGDVVDEGDGVVRATVAVADRPGRRERLGGADVGGVEGLGERAGVGAGERAAVIGRDRRRGGGRVVALGVGRGGDGDGAGGDLTGGVVDERHEVVGAAVAVADRTGRGECLGGADVGVVEGLGERTRCRCRRGCRR